MGANKCLRRGALQSSQHAARRSSENELQIVMHLLKVVLFFDDYCAVRNKGALMGRHSNAL